MSQLTGPSSTQIQKMFSQVAHKYDRANTVLSMGIHHLWRKKLVQLSGIKEGGKVLDCATGTGDLAIAFAKAVGPKGAVIGSDFCEEMMKPAPLKAIEANVSILFQQADVTDLPFDGDFFDASSISFGIRNVEDPVKGISELARVVRPGGNVMILEFGQPNIPVFRQAYNFYSKKILPQIGGWVTGQKKAYEYLQTSSADFPCQQKFVDLIKSTGQFDQVEYWPLSGGIAYIYKAQKSTKA